MTRLDQVNQLLAQWDPIGVGFPYATSEYLSYAKHLASGLLSSNEVLNYLQDVYANALGFELTPVVEADLIRLSQEVAAVVATDSK